MTNKILALIAIALITGGAWLVVLRPQPPVPLVDANLNVLAESPAQGYCAGVTFWTVPTNQGDARGTKACVEASDLSNERDLAVVQRHFCYGVIDEGYQNGVTQCMAIMEGQRFWPTKDGKITDAWSSSAPYPGDQIQSGGGGDVRPGGNER